MTESESGQSFNRTTFGGDRGEVDNGHTGAQQEGSQDGHEERGDGIGTVVEVKGPVVDVRFPPEDIPEIFNAVTVPIETDGETTELTLEVQQLLGDDMVRTVAMASTDGLRRGVDAKDSGRPIDVPVGKNVQSGRATGRDRAWMSVVGGGWSEGDRRRGATTERK